MSFAEAPIGSRSYQNRGIDDLSARSSELVIGIVGYAGAGCSTISKKIKSQLDAKGYNSNIIKLSEQIEKNTPNFSALLRPGSPDEGNQKIARAIALQDAGDALREKYGNHVVASLAVGEIRSIRGDEVSDNIKNAYILDSIKHKDEVILLRKLYEESFRLVAVHCDLEGRENRLISELGNRAKFEGADHEKVRRYMRRDEKDKNFSYGQGVRDAFYLADYFLDNNANSVELIADDISRFISVLLGSDLARPTKSETGMYLAHAAALKSSCLSRQVGAALQNKDGDIIAIGHNEVPKFGGGTYQHGEQPDSRCHLWDWKKGTEPVFRGCHNSRSKQQLRMKLAEWSAETFPSLIFERLKKEKIIDSSINYTIVTSIKKLLLDSSDIFIDAPELGDLIEYSRSIHAEMDAILSAARSGSSVVGGTLYCTTFPCHNCARHLITAGIHKVYYIEPYVKSRALDLHNDALTTNAREAFTQDTEKQIRMEVTPFTGIGPRMYEDHFVKLGDLKVDGTGEYHQPVGGIPVKAVRLRELAEIERGVAEAALTELPAAASND